MSLQTRLNALISAIKTETKAIRVLITGTNNGDVSGLTTTATNIVDAVNELKSALDAVGAGGAEIDDAVVSLTKVWSSTKTSTEIANAVAALVGSAPGTLDTLQELATALAEDAAFATTMTAALANKANTSDIYTQAQLGNPETDLVALWSAA